MQESGMALTYFVLTNSTCLSQRKFLKINQWNEGMCKVFGDVLSDGPLSWNLLMKCEGISLHLTDVCVEELMSVSLI
eukprot:m.251135 g.251135  ORF g.251135 m.251135 type:complete len:77 (+) comp40333_c0_seq7:615-845(+)